MLSNHELITFQTGAYKLKRHCLERAARILNNPSFTDNKAMALRCVKIATKEIGK